MKKFLRAGIALAVVSVLGWLVACSDHPGGPIIEPRVDSLIVSDPVLAAGVASGTAAASARASSGGDPVAYVSLPPGAVPTGSRVSIRRVGNPAFVTTAVLDGGFDPVAVAATAGDAIEVRVTDAGGGTVLVQVVAVRAARPPIVVRTQPPRRKTDVPLNSAIIVYFSEPVDSATVTPVTIRMERGTTAVSGTLRFVDATHLSVEFVPNAPLDAGSAYRLIVTGQVRDLSGEVLAAPDTVPFTTGGSSVGEPASIRLSPDSVLNLQVGSFYEIMATVRDAGGNVLTGQTLTWTSSDPAVATVTPADSNRVRAVSPGSVTITATSGTLSGTAIVTVIAPVPNGLASLTFSPDSLTLPAMDGQTVIVIARDANGKELLAGAVPGGRLEVTLTSTNPNVLRSGGTITSDYCGWGTGIFYCPGWNHLWIQPFAEGSTMLIATSEGVSDTAFITADPRRVVASVTVEPWSTRMLAGDSVALLATLRDANGTPITWKNGGQRPVDWTSDNPAVATVDTGRQAPTGRMPLDSGGGEYSGHEIAMVTAVGAGSATITATSEGFSATAAITPQPLISFTSVSAGTQPDWNDSFGYEDATTCGVTTGGDATCWGYNIFREPSDDSYLPDLPAGGPPWSSVSVGMWYTCGLTTAGAAQCSGSNQFGQLGDGTTGYSGGGPVAGGLSFVRLSAGYSHTCGLTTAGAAYCWGRNWYGVLGDGSTTDRSVPVAVSGELSFVAVSAGYSHSCGLTAAGAAYCWGNNSQGQLGDSSTTDRSIPVTVMGGLTFASVVAGHYVSCGLTAAGTAYCWGYNREGAIGDGTTTNRPIPVAVSGGHSFVALTAGRAAANICGLTAAGVAYCWGYNNAGQLGDGGGLLGGGQTDLFNKAVPTAVVGGLRFSSVSAGGYHTCAMSTTAIAYCWGRNYSGALGIPNVVIGGVPVVVVSGVPVKVAGQP